MHQRIGDDIYSQEETYPQADILPERRLIAAVLARAIVDLSGSSSLPLLVIQSAYDWVFKIPHPPDYELTFDRVCDVLDLSPSAMREAIRQQLDAANLEGLLRCAE